MTKQATIARGHPDLVAQWHPTLNGDLTPDAVTAGSGRKPWWLCENGHAWSATVKNRVRGKGCPYCSGRLPIAGETDLVTTHPDLVAQWHPTLNGDVTPDMVTAGSHRTPWWLCKNGHSWKALVFDRAIHGTDCPFCSGRMPSVGETDLATTHPDLAAQWHPTLNGDLTPTMVSAGSSKRKPWWLCDRGHAWAAEVRTRATGTGCPYCAGFSPIPGETDLATTHPDLAAQWHPTLNGNMTPAMVSAGSSRRTVWWLCENGHAWSAVARDRVRGKRCPYCVDVTR